MKCIGYGIYEGKCQNKAGTPWTPAWCMRCDVIRRKTITKQLEGIRDSFSPKVRREDY